MSIDCPSFTETPRQKQIPTTKVNVMYTIAACACLSICGKLKYRKLTLLAEEEHLLASVDQLYSSDQVSCISSQ